MKTIHQNKCYKKRFARSFRFRVWKWLHFLNTKKKWTRWTYHSLTQLKQNLPVILVKNNWWSMQHYPQNCKKLLEPPQFCRNFHGYVYIRESFTYPLNMLKKEHLQFFKIRSESAERIVNLPRRSESFMHNKWFTTFLLPEFDLRYSFLPLPSSLIYEEI